LDIPINIVTAHNDGNAEEQSNFVFSSGILSSFLEHAVPEQIFNTDTNGTLDAVSAVKLLQKAVIQGQKIYQITQANISSIMPLLNLGVSTKKEIEASIASGLEVIAHTHQISMSGYIGEGYIIVDPENGSGAYKISGAGNGGLLVLIAMFAFAIIGIIAALSGGLLIAAALGGGLLFFSMDVQRIADNPNLGTNGKLAKVKISLLLNIFTVALAAFGRSAFISGSLVARAEVFVGAVVVFVAKLFN